MKESLSLPGRETALLLLGPNDSHLRLLREKLKVKLVLKGNELVVEGNADNVSAAIVALNIIIQSIDTRNDKGFDHEKLQWLLAGAGQNPDSSPQKIIIPGGNTIEPKSGGQKTYINAVRSNDIVFGIGPAGTGKTYLAVACAVEALKLGYIRRIILARPAVEAGEKLGFLPGDMQDKVNPYLRPLYDALDDMLSRVEKVQYLETGVIEVAPLAFMRGRTLNKAFVILDEAQNATAGQMKMFLTRLGADSKAIVTGDITQVDLESGKQSGLVHAREILSGIKGISFVELSDQDVVRHRLVRNIINAYDLDNK
ncbi:MAG: PhoH family protein [Planctomycetota bacterium]|jgi:phosphate starvation-inducible PhoH-like protein